MWHTLFMFTLAARRFALSGTSSLPFSPCCSSPASLAQYLLLGDIALSWLIIFRFIIMPSYQSNECFVLCLGPRFCTVGLQNPKRIKWKHLQLTVMLRSFVLKGSLFFVGVVHVSYTSIHALWTFHIVLQCNLQPYFEYRWNCNAKQHMFWSGRKII